MIELSYIPRFVTGGLVDSHALLYRIFVYCIHYGSHVNPPQPFLEGTIDSSFSPDSVSIITFGALLRGSGKARVTNPSGDHVGSSPRPIFRRCFPSLLATQT